MVLAELVGSPDQDALSELFWEVLARVLALAEELEICCALAALVAVA